VLGLDSGADDYLVKPVDPAELAARLRVLQRRTGTALQAGWRLGEVELDLAAHAARLAGQRVELTAREWALVEALVRRAGRIVSKPDLERLVLGAEADVQSNALEVHVSSLRRKLGRDLIETVRGLGYRIPAGA
jgi:two-component system, OmpR family, response regulator